MLHISINAQLTHEPIVLEHFQCGSLNVFSRHLFADIISVHNGNMCCVLFKCTQSTNIGTSVKLCVASLNQIYLTYMTMHHTVILLAVNPLRPKVNDRFSKISKYRLPVYI